MQAKPLFRIKVCGLTSLEDALMAAEAGADALGFVHFAGSPRHLSTAELGELGAAIGESAPCALVARVLVLVSPRPDQALALAEGAQFTHVQLAGALNARDWAGFPLPLLRSLAVDDGALTGASEWSPLATALVLDHPSSAGGSGLEVDAALAKRIATESACLLAGGLHAANVGRLVAAVRPFGVDASSRLELQPGRKDPLAVQAFVAAARCALGPDSSISTTGPQQRTSKS